MVAPPKQRGPWVEQATFKGGSFCAQGRYAIVSLLSFGGFAEVFEAFDLKTGELRALKVLQIKHDGNQNVERRFIDEALVGSKLSHPNLVRVFDAGKDEDTGFLYLVLELLEGTTLAKKIAWNQKLPLLWTLDRIVELLEALEYLHQQGVIHRDVKAENTFITKTGRTVLLDLGNARFERLGLPTTKQSIVGTPIYMSPEHVRGDKVDARGDVYSVCTLLFECLAGLPPALVKKPDLVNIATISAFHLHQDVPHLCDAQPDLPRELGNVIARGLEKDRDKRFPSAKTLANALEGIRRALRATNFPDPQPKDHERRLLEDATTVEQAVAPSKAAAPAHAPVRAAPDPSPPPAVYTARGTQMLGTRSREREPAPESTAPESTPSSVPSTDAARPGWTPSAAARGRMSTEPIALPKRVSPAAADRLPGSKPVHEAWPSARVPRPTEPVDIASSSAPAHEVPARAGRHPAILFGIGTLGGIAVVGGVMFAVTSMRSSTSAATSPAATSTAAAAAPASGGAPSASASASNLPVPNSATSAGR